MCYKSTVRTQDFVCSHRRPTRCINRLGYDVDSHALRHQISFLSRTIHICRFQTLCRVLNRAWELLRIGCHVVPPCQQLLFIYVFCTCTANIFCYSVATRSAQHLGLAKSLHLEEVEAKKGKEKKKRKNIMMMMMIISYSIFCLIQQ